MLSNTCKYAIRAVVYLAIHDDGVHKIGIKQISKSLNLPTPFLGKILQSLAKQKLLSSTKGPRGGFGIGKDPHQIALIEIVEIIDGLGVFNNCLIGLSICKNNKKHIELCPFHQKSDPLRFELKQTFKAQTIGELADKLRECKENLQV